MFLFYSIITFLVSVVLTSGSDSGHVIRKRFDWHDEGSLQWSTNCDFFGNDLSDAQVPGERCGPSCESNPECSHFTWTGHNGGTCWMKRGGTSLDMATYLAENSVCGMMKGRGGGSQTTTDKLWGLAYSPWRGQSSCAVSEQQINEDLSQIARYASAVRTYGLDCDFAEKIVRLTRQNGLKLMLGLWVTGDQSQYANGKTKLENILKSRPDLGHVIAVNVGNEVLYRNEMSEGELIGKIREIRDLLRRYGYQTPVTTVDVFDKYSNNLASSVDIVVTNLHTFFSNQPVDNSHNIVFDLIGRLRSMPGSSGKTLLVGETGWPSGGSDGRANQQNEWKYLKNFHCRANREKLGYFYFEAFDATWKNLGDGNIESHWGLGNADRSFKGGLAEAMQC